jgi:hypothetical protein
MEHTSGCGGSLGNAPLRWRIHIQVDEMPNLIVCFALGVVAPLASVGWLIAYH